MHTDYGDPNKRPQWGAPEDWGFDDMFGAWVYVGDDEDLEKRCDRELTLWENDYEYGPHPSLPRIPPYDKKYVKAARITIKAAIILCVILLIWLVFN